MVMNGQQVNDRNPVGNSINTQISRGTPRGFANTPTIVENQVQNIPNKSIFTKNPDNNGALKSVGLNEYENQKTRSI